VKSFNLSDFSEWNKIPPDSSIFTKINVAVNTLKLMLVMFFTCQKPVLGHLVTPPSYIQCRYLVRCKLLCIGKKQNYCNVACMICSLFAHGPRNAGAGMPFSTYMLLPIMQAGFSWQITVHDAKVLCTPISYLGGPGFIYQPRNWLS
jgi:hypothetical protein